MSKILANQIANYGDDAPIEIKEGLNIPTGKPIQAAGVSGTSGQVLTSTGSTISWTTPFDGDYNSLTNLPTIPAAQVNSDWNATSGVSRILNKPLIPPLPSVTTNAAGTAALSYNSVNGQFTYTPPDLSNYDTAYGWGDHGAAGYALSSAIANSSNWDTAYGWGDHAAAGYLTSEADTLATVLARGNTSGANDLSVDAGRKITFGSKLEIFHDNTLNYNIIQSGDNAAPLATLSDIIWFYNRAGSQSIADFDNTTVRLYCSGNAKLETTTEGVTINGDLSVSGTTDLDIEDLNNVDITSGLSDQQVLKWDAASSSWKPANDLVGGAQGVALVDLSVTTAAAGTAALSYNNTNGVFTYTPPDLSVYATTAAVANAANWDTAYGWGDHAAAGYLTSYTETDPVFSISPAASISTVQINNWNSAYSWGDHSAQGYLTSYTETDPVFSASVASGITSTDTSNWNTAYGWGDHASGGYLTTVALNDVSDVTITSPTSGQVLSYNGSAWVNTAAATGNTQVTISDTLPGGTPSAGDLWWESDTGRLKIYYQDVDGAQWVDTNPPLADTNNPAAKGFINMNGSSPTWTGTAGYTVAHSGGGGSDEVYTLTFPSAYGARTDYIVNADYDGTNWIAGNGAQLGIVRNAGNVQITVRRWNEDPLNQGEIMITIHNL